MGQKVSTDLPDPFVCNFLQLFAFSIQNHFQFGGFTDVMSNPVDESLPFNEQSQGILEDSDMRELGQWQIDVVSSDLENMRPRFYRVR